MKITKFGHSCVLVEGEEAGQTRVALFDPGVWNDIPVEMITQLDDVCISHSHADHLDVAKLQAIVAAFPGVRITAPTEVVTMLHQQGMSQAADVAPMGMTLFAAPHEGHLPFLDPPQEIGVHFLEAYTHPGDSHSFTETKAVLALPVQAPWGSTIDAVDLAIRLRPRYVLPIHDWHWHEEARAWAYDRLESIFAEEGIILLKPQNGQTLQVDA